jgi:hypothetical protein
LQDLIPSGSFRVVFSLLGRSGTEPTITEATVGLLYQPRIMMEDDECGAIGGMIGREP